jgi:hypothetical protein
VVLVHCDPAHRLGTNVASAGVDVPPLAGLANHPTISRPVRVADSKASVRTRVAESFCGFPPDPMWIHAARCPRARAWCQFKYCTSARMGEIGLASDQERTRCFLQRRSPGGRRHLAVIVAIQADQWELIVPSNRDGTRDSRLMRVGPLSAHSQSRS